ncbi:IclR family transcriptional regulator, partial [Streptomyces sp. UH6]|uniref:IclR family transcriptional regulator n=1 Tax=Streptomyces sp. UH6 TaxID=2748379 RepID=UPI0015D507AF
MSHGTPAPHEPASGTAGRQTAVDKALHLMMTLAETGESIGVSGLARRTGLSKSTAFRLLGILERNAVVEKVGSAYRLGTQLYDLGTRGVYGSSIGLRERLVPHLAELYESTHETVHLAVLHGTEVVYANKLYGHRPTPCPSRIGSRLPASVTAVGKVLLAFDPEAAEAVIEGGLHPATAHSITDPVAFRAHLARIRAAGVAEDHEESTPGLSCVAVPVLGPAGLPVAALSVA